MIDIDLNAPAVLLEGKFGPKLGAYYANPDDLIVATTLEEVPSALSAIDKAVARGRHVAGFLSYELGYALEPRLHPLIPSNMTTPLIWMGVFTEPTPPLWTEQSVATIPAAIGTSLTQEAYKQNIKTILNYIRAGDVYQVNYTYRLNFDAPTNPIALYAALKTNQPVPYPALINTGELTILSLSPELFFETDEEIIRSRPMKGTMPRKNSHSDDMAQSAALLADKKNRAENLMIVDLLRNDISKITKPGSVEVSDLFALETYRTLHTLTSTIEATLNSQTPPSRIIEALFPCGSITGAPKIRAMEIIHELEQHPRGVYTGAIGVFRPDNSSCFNVAIRTLAIQNHSTTVGVGGGIVLDSLPLDEGDETLLKARFLTELSPYAADQDPMRLIETIRWTPENGFYLLNEHLDRLTQSAAYFLFPTSREKIKVALAKAIETHIEPQRIRLLLDADGVLDITCAALGVQRDSWSFVISPTRIHSTDPYLQHKTTRRGLYDSEYARVRKKLSCEEVLFLNERGELSEGSRANIFIERDRQLLTPPLHAGALPGTLRRSLIESGKAREQTLFPADLATGLVYLGNSVRGLILSKTV